MNTKPKGVSGSFFIGLDIFKRKLRIADEKKGIYKGGLSIDFSIQNNIIKVADKPANFDCDYVILLNGELRMGKSHYYLSEMADEVLSAGRLGIENGKIEFLDNWSGHYNPNMDDLTDASNFFVTNHLTGTFFQAYFITFY